MTNYEELSFKEIYTSMLRDAHTRGLINDDFYEHVLNGEDISNFYVLLLAVHSQALQETYKQLTWVYESSKIDYAEGSDLDDLGALINIPRPAATRSIVELTFTTTVNDPEDEPEGLKVATSTGVVFETVEPLNFIDGTGTVLAYSLNTGEASRVESNTLNSVQSNTRNPLKVTNLKPSTGGVEAANDNQYRELLKNWLNVMQKGNEWAYIDYFHRLDGVDDYRIVPCWDGTGTIKIILSPSNPYFMNKVYTELQETVTQATEDITIVPPTDKKIDIYINCNVDIDRVNPYSTTEKDRIQGAIETEIKKYLSSMRIGEDFIPLKLAVAINNNISEVKNIEFNNPVRPVVVSDDERCKLGEVEIVME